MSHTYTDIFHSCKITGLSPLSPIQLVLELVGAFGWGSLEEKQQ